MRGAIPRLPNHPPLVELLPSVLQEDEFTSRLTTGLDDVLGSVVATLDCLDAYVDPWLAPDDMVHWLAGWVGADVESGPAVGQDGTLGAMRATVAEAVALHRIHGTLDGVRRRLALVFGEGVAVTENGGVFGCQEPTDPAGLTRHEPAVRVTLPGEGAVDERRARHIARSLLPAHVTVTVVTGGDGRREG